MDFKKENKDTDRQDNLNKLVINSVLKRYKTVFIGNIDAVDKIIGTELWGYGKDAADLTEDEQNWLIVREKLRKLILDNGNKQMRDTEDELDGYNLVVKKSFLP